MSDHPTRETLEALLCGRLPAAQRKSVVAHLVGGCNRCRSEMSPLTAVMFKPGRPPAVAFEVNTAEDPYDRALSSAYAAALDRERLLAKEREDASRKLAQLLYGAWDPEDLPLQGESGFWTWGLCEALLDKAAALRHDDPEAMLHLTNLARIAVEKLSADLYGGRWLADLQTRVWGELANALRITGDLVRSETAMSRALEHRERGTEEPLILARLAELAASLCSAQRKFADAFRIVDLAAALYGRYGNTHDVGRTLILKGIYTGRSGEPAEAVRLLARGLAMVDGRRDPRVVFQTLHNILLFRVENGDFLEARLQLRQMRPLYARFAGRVDLIKLRGMEGKIAFGLGELDRAEAEFLQVRAEFEEAGLGYRAALATLDLASVRLRQGKTSEVRQLVGELVGTFKALGVEREAMAALRMLHESVQQDRATLTMLEFVSGVLQRHERGPAARLDPEGR